VSIGCDRGAIQGFFAGKTDLAFQRFIEIWDSMPELYLLIIFSAIFSPSVALLLILLALFGLDRAVERTCGPSSCATGRWTTCAPPKALGVAQRPDHVEAHPARTA
jgi:hypothetical protein